MKTLQLDVNKISYELVKPEASVYEEAREKRQSIENALAILIAVEKGDSKENAEKAANDFIAFAKKQKLDKIVLYPFAHISNNLDNPERALGIFKHLEDYTKKTYDGQIFSAPFGWNKQLSIDVKGYPLAEQSRSYGSSELKAEEKKQIRERMDSSILKKSDWAGLPPTDHRSIGDRLDLYSGQEISPGMVYWHSGGFTLYKELQRFLREKYFDYDYEELSTPSMANTVLWHVSGHWDHYKENMFIVDYESGQLGLKPMNCPSTIMIYKTKRRSYKELPFRTAIFDRVYRREVSGALGGLFRVQELTQDDGHIFATEDQLEDEMGLLLKFVKEVYAVFDLKFTANLSTKDPNNYMGSDELWEKATEALKKSLAKNHLEYSIKEGDAAFYGPKIDFLVIDSAGRSWQCATIQMDYQLPLNFKLSYMGEDGKEHMPIMIHRAIFGSIERFIGVLTEHYQGKFPSWLAPMQVSVLAISDKSSAYAAEIAEKLKKSRIRTSLNISDRTLDYKIREVKNLEIPYAVIVGSKEQEAKTISVRDREGKQTQGLKIEAFIELLQKEISERENRLTVLHKLDKT